MRVQGRRKRGALRRKEGDGNESTREKEGLREDGWTKYRMISNRRDCRLMKCTTVLHGGVCHRTSTPHKSWKKMKKKSARVDLQRQLFPWWFRGSRIQRPSS